MADIGKRRRVVFRRIVPAFALAVEIGQGQQWPRAFRIGRGRGLQHAHGFVGPAELADAPGGAQLRSFRRSEEHTSELQSLMRISYAVFCLKKKKTYNYKKHII